MSKSRAQSHTLAYSHLSSSACMYTRTIAKTTQRLGEEELQKRKCKAEESCNRTECCDKKQSTAKQDEQNFYTQRHLFGAFFSASIVHRDKDGWMGG